MTTTATKTRTKKNNNSSTMKGFVAVIVLMICVNCVDSESCLTKPLAEGSTEKFKKYVAASIVPDKKVQWKLEAANGTTFTVTECDFDQRRRCKNVFGDDRYSFDMKWHEPASYEISVIIQNINLFEDQTTWSWGTERRTLGSCFLDVYSFQSDIVCQAIEKSTRMVKWRCSVDNVYPDMDCRFEYKKGIFGELESISRRYIRKSTDLGKHPHGTTYNNYTCTMLLPISQLKSGNFEFQFEFKAVVVSTSEDLQFKSSGKQDVKFVSTVVELANCPDYLIKEYDKTKTCQCRVKEPGDPPGDAKWMNSYGVSVGYKGTNSDYSTLNIYHNPEDRNPVFTCKGYSELGDGNSVKYTPQFAYGPRKISMDLPDHFGTINKCDPDVSFTVYCDVEATSVNPKPTVKVSASDGSIIKKQRDTKQSGLYRYTFAVFPQRGGILTITCTATNTQFPDLTKGASKRITVREPPPSRPVMTVNNGQPIENNAIVVVTNGDTIEVKCRVNGGYPRASDITTTCDWTPHNHLEATQTIHVAKENNNKKCRCRANHASHCYDKSLEFTLNVHYAPDVKHYVANSESSELTILENDSVTFNCDVEGNPKPDVSVRGQKSQNVVTLRDTPTGPFSKLSQGTKQMLCKDTDVYTCTANNGVGDEKQKTVSVFVKCSPELPSGEDSSVKEFKTINGTGLKIEVPIISYPTPTVYSLKLVSTKEKRASTPTDVESGMYHVRHIAGQPPESTVVLLMFGITFEDTGQYVLNIDNGIGSGLDYTFNITVVAAKTGTNTENGSDDKGLEIGTGIGIGAGIIVSILVLAFVCFLVWKKIKKNRRFAEQRKQHQQEQQPQQQQQQQQQQPQQRQRQAHYRGRLQDQYYETDSIYEDLDRYDNLDPDEIQESQPRQKSTYNTIQFVPPNRQNSPQRNHYSVYINGGREAPQHSNINQAFNMESTAVSSELYDLSKEPNYLDLIEEESVNDGYEVALNCRM